MRIRTANRKRRGFSLLELLAVVTIMGVIAAVVIPRISSSKRSAAEKVNEQNIAEINSAIERYYFENNKWPTALSDIDNATYFPDGIPKNPTDDSAYVLDTTNNKYRVKVPATTTTTTQ